MSNSFISYYLKAFIRPRRTFDLLLSDDRRFRFGFFFVLIPAVLYTIMYIFLTIGNGAPSVFTPWLNIPKDVYYAWNRFLVAPSMFISWLLAAAVIQVLSRLVKGEGSFEDTLSVIALCISVAMWSTLLHDLIMSFLSAVGTINAREHEIAMNSPTVWRVVIWTCMTAYLIWFILLFTKGIAAVHKITTQKALIIGILGFAIFQGMFLVFNR